MKITARFALVALTAAVVAAFGVAPAGATYPGSNGLIAFVTSRAGFPQIWTVDPTTGVEHNVSNDGTAESAPAWSPFGTKLAYSSGDDVWVMRANGTQRVDLTASDMHGDDEPTWSPDGKKIAFVSDRDTTGRTQIYVMQANGAHVVRRTNDAGNDTDPQWSPDGKHIAFVSDVSGNLDVWSMHPSGAALKDLTNNTTADGAPSWSPDSTHIVFTSGRSHPGSVGADLFVMNADGSDPTAFVHEANGYSDGDGAAFSPDASEFVFSANDGAGSQQLWLDSVGGGENVRLTNDSGNPHDVAADWQPVVPAPVLTVKPRTAAPGSDVNITGRGFAPGEHVKLTLTDADGTKTLLLVATADNLDGEFPATATLPADAANGAASITALGATSALVARKPFVVSTS
jgi:Tol biopolymer transport system component